ncbi:MAG: DNA repair protein RecO [Holosporaceae bacterium]|nr:DNA repair protein RecO [Holosporaceae bacterium]
MQWQENSVVLSTKLFAEDSRILTVFNETIGKTSGLIKNSKTSAQPGDISNIFWRGRTSDQLGTFRVENVFSPFTCVFNDPFGIFSIESVCFLCLKGLPEKAPHPKLFHALKTFLLSISCEDRPENYVFFEMDFLAEVGFGMDLSRCALTGKTEDLFYISPRTGRAAGRVAGEKYKDRLFVLPQFLISENVSPSDYDIFCALSITGHFLRMYFHDISNGKLPLSRDYLMAELSEKIKGAA